MLGIANFRAKAGGLDMVAIAYKGTGQAVTALVSGEVQMFFMNPLVAISHVKSGKLRALAVTALTRNTALPDVRERFLGQGLTPVGSTPEQMAALIKEESAEYAKLVKQIGYEPQ